MFTITTTYGTTPAGAGKVTAKGNGKQRTVRYDDALSADANHGAAAGALLNVLTTPEQQAKVKHPSGGQRVREVTDPASWTARQWTVNV